MCVCVSTPGPRVSSNRSTCHLYHHRFISRGQRDLQSWPLPTKLHTGRSGKRTCFQHTDSTGPPCRCSLFSWSFFMLPSPKQRIFPLHFSADRDLQPAANCRLAPEETILNNTVLADSCTLPFPHHFPNVVTESLKTNVRVCFAQPSHSGAECDPRHRGAVFA